MFRAGLPLVALLLLGSPGWAASRTFRVKPEVAKALKTFYQSTGNRLISTSKAGVTLDKMTGTAWVGQTGSVVTVNRKIGSRATILSASKENLRGGMINVDLTTGTVTYTYSFDWGASICFPVLWGICGPCVQGGLSLTAFSTDLNISQEAYFGGGFGCGIGCATIGGYINFYGGVYERYLPYLRRLEMGLSRYGNVAISANLCSVVKFTLAQWPLYKTEVPFVRMTV